MLPALPRHHVELGVKNLKFLVITDEKQVTDGMVKLTLPI